MWTPEERAYHRGLADAYHLVLDKIAQGCPEDCGEMCLTFTDCCEEPRWKCETRLVNGDVTVCAWNAGCALDTPTQRA